jgi:putative transposase
MFQELIFRPEFEPQFIQKHQRRFDGFDDKTISPDARRLTVREIQGRLQEIYVVAVSPELMWRRQI